MAYRVKTAVTYDPTFDYGQSAFKAYWQGHLGRAEINMQIWKARLKMASPDTRRAIENDLRDRIYKLQKLKTDMIKAKTEGNQELLMKTMELIQRDKASQRTLAGQKVRTAGGLSEQRTERLLQFENSGPTGAEAALIGDTSKRIGPLIGKISPSSSGRALLTDPNMMAAFTKLEETFTGAVGKANTQLEVDRVTADIMGELMKMNTGAGDRGSLIKRALIERLARVVSDRTNVKYGSGSEMYNTLTMKYSDRALGLTKEQVAPIMGYGASAFRPGSIINQMGGPGAFGGGTTESIVTTASSIDTEIKRLRGELEKAKVQTVQSQQEFEDLLSRGLGNLALRPVASKLTPSPIANYLRQSADLYRADPEYAESVLDAFEAGETELPTPFSELKEEPLTRYTSGADYISQSIGELSDMVDREVSPFAPEEAKKMARAKIMEMANAIKPTAEGGFGVLGSDLSKFSEKIAVRVGENTLEGTLPEVMKTVETFLADEEMSVDQKDQLVQATIDGLKSGFGEIKVLYDLRQMPLKPSYRKETALNVGLSDRIQNALDTKAIGDSSKYYGQLTQIYNDIVQKPTSLRGGIENEFVNSIDTHILDPNTRNPDLLEFKLRELGKVSTPDFGDI